MIGGVCVVSFSIVYVAVCGFGLTYDQIDARNKKNDDLEAEMADEVMSVSTVPNEDT